MNYLKTKNNIKVPVSKEIYSQINSIQNRTNYVTKKLKESGLIYYESYSFENNTGESRIKDYSASSTEVIIKEQLYIIIFRLYKC